MSSLASRIHYHIFLALSLPLSFPNYDLCVIIKVQMKSNNELKVKLFLSTSNSRKIFFFFFCFPSSSTILQKLFISRNISKRSWVKNSHLGENVLNRNLNIISPNRNKWLWQITENSKWIKSFSKAVNWVFTKAKTGFWCVFFSFFWICKCERNMWKVKSI